MTIEPTTEELELYKTIQEAAEIIIRNSKFGNCKPILDGLSDEELEYLRNYQPPKEEI